MNEFIIFIIFGRCDRRVYLVVILLYGIEFVLIFFVKCYWIGRLNGFFNNLIVIGYIILIKLRVDILFYFFYVECV